MRVVVRLFASYREAAGMGRIEIELPPGATVKDAIADVVKRYPLIAEGRKVVIAKNREYVDATESVADGDEVALIPPVSGGATDARGRAVRSTSIAPIMVSAAALSLDDALEAVRDPGYGGIVLFLGTVRSHSRGKRVTHLEYEAYAEMAEAKMREIATELESRYAPSRVVMHHRVGDLAIGDVAVIVATAAPHRDAAFAAAREAIDTLKTIVPIWKKEFAEDGAVWIEEHA